MPQLRELHLERLSVHKFIPAKVLYESYPYNHDYTYRLEVLELRIGQFSEEGLMEVFKRAPRLRIIKLAVETIFTNGGMNQMKVFQIPNLQKTLEELELIDDEYERYHGLIAPYGLSRNSVWIGDLSQFWGLRRLKIDRKFLSLPDGVQGFCADYLPNRLDYLCFLTDNRPSHADIVSSHRSGNRRAFYEGSYEKSINADMVPTFRIK